MDAQRHSCRVNALLLVRRLISPRQNQKPACSHHALLPSCSNLQPRSDAPMVMKSFARFFMLNAIHAAVLSMRGKQEISKCLTWRRKEGRAARERLRRHLYQATANRMQPPTITPGMMTQFPRPEPFKQVALTQSTSTCLRRHASASGGRSYATQSEKSQLGGIQSIKIPPACPSLDEAGDSEDFRCLGLTIPPCISEEERSALFHATLIPPCDQKVVGGAGSHVYPVQY